ncbi:MAG: hypothetical protein EOO75_12010 [Myxococcales bacterium]|nr:MAG: hypothetical protein EOO75_12010 [Myxococcales bacterium]
MTARSTAARLGLALALGAGRASADDDTKAIGGTDGATLLAGTPRYRVAVDAARTNAKVFGAVGAFERQILPAFSRPYSGDVFGGEIIELLGGFCVSYLVETELFGCFVELV